MPSRPGQARGLACSAGDVELAVRRVGDDAVRRAAVADAAGEGAGVDAGDAGRAVRAQPGVEMLGGAPVRRLGDRAAHDQAARRRRDGLDVLGVGADIADMREGEGDDLPGIGGIGHDLLVAGHRGVEADLADRLSGAPKPRPQNTVPSASTSAAVAQRRGECASVMEAILWAGVGSRAIGARRRNLPGRRTNGGGAYSDGRARVGTPLTQAHAGRARKAPMKRGWRIPVYLRTTPRRKDRQDQRATISTKR